MGREPREANPLHRTELGTGIQEDLEVRPTQDIRWDHQEELGHQEEVDHREVTDHREEMDRLEDMDPLGRRDGQEDLGMEEKDHRDMEDRDRQGHQDHLEEARAGLEPRTE